MKKTEFFAAPVAGFIAVMIDDSDATYGYTQFENVYGEWYILRQNKATGEFKYASSYVSGVTLAAGWTGRVALAYNLPSVAFSSLK